MYYITVCVSDDLLLSNDVRPSDKERITTSHNNYYEIMTRMIRDDEWYYCISLYKSNENESRVWECGCSSSSSSSSNIIIRVGYLTSLLFDNIDTLFLLFLVVPWWNCSTERKRERRDEPRMRKSRATYSTSFTHSPDRESKLFLSQ